MVRRSPNKSGKSTKPRNGSNLPDAPATAAVPTAAAAATALDPQLAPRLDPDDEADDPWSPTRNNKLRSPSRPLAHQLSSLQQDKDLVDNRLWETTVELQEQIRQRQVYEDQVAQLRSELKSLKSEYESGMQSLESYKNEERELQDALVAAQRAAAQEKQTSLEKIESRDEFIDKLQAQIDTLRADLQGHQEQLQQQQKKLAEAAASAETGARGTRTAGQNSADNSMSWGTDDYEGQLSHTSLVGQTPASSDLLATIGHHKHQQKKMRDLLKKQRKENYDLKQKLAELGVSREELSDIDSDISTGTINADSGVSYDTTTSGDLSSVPGDVSGGTNAEAVTAKPTFSLSDELEAEDLHQPRQSTRSPPASLYTQAHAFKHELVPFAKYQELSNRAAQADANHNNIGFEELKRLAAQLNYSVMTNEEYANYDKLLHKKYAARGVQSHVLMDLARQNTFELRTPSKFRTHWSATHEVPETVKEYTEENNLALIPTSLSSFAELASELGLVTFPREQLLPGSTVGGGATSGSTTTDPAVSTDQLVCIVPKSKVHEVQKVLGNPPSNDELIAAAAAQGLAVVPVKQFERLESEARRQQTQIPLAEEVADLARKAGLQVIPQNPTVDELQQIVSEDVVLVERETFEALESPGPATLTRLAKQHNMVVLPQTEVERLRSGSTRGSIGGASGGGSASGSSASASADVSAAGDESVDLSENDLSVERLRDIAERKNMIVLSASDYQQMLRVRDPREFGHLPMSQRTKFLEQLISSQNSSGAGSGSGSASSSGGAGGSSTSSPSPLKSPAGSLGTMEDRARRMGLILITPEEHQQLKQSRVYEPTKADVIKSARDFGLATIPIDEWSQLRSLKWKSASLEASATSAHGVTNKKGSDSEAEVKAVPAKYLEALQRFVEEPKRSEVASMATKVGLVTFDAEDTTQLLAKARELGLVDPLSDDEIKQKAHSLGLVEPPTDEDTKAKALTLGLVAPLSDDQVKVKALDLGLVNPLSEEEIRSKALGLGLVIPPTDDQIKSRALSLISDDEIIARALQLGLTHPLTEDQIREKALALGLVYPLTSDEIKEKALGLGLVYPSTDDDVKSKALGLGLVHAPTEDEIKQKALTLGLINPLSDKDIRARAHNLGLADPLSEDQVKERALGLGLTNPLSETEIKEKALSLGLVNPLSETEIKEKALSLGLISPLSESEIKERALSLGLINPLSDGEVKERALSLGLINPLKTQEIKEKALGLGLINPLSEEEIKERALSLGLANPLSEDEIKQRALSLGLVEPQTQSQIKEQALALGLIEPLTEDDIKSRAAQLGLATNDDEVKNKALNLGLTHPPTEDQIKSKALELGLAHPLSDDQIKARALELGLAFKLSDDEVKSKALDLGLTHPPSETEITERASQLGFAPALSDEELKSQAKELGLVDPPSEGDIRRRAQALGMISAEEVPAQAKSLGLVLTDEQIKAKALELGLAKPLSDDEIRAKSRSLGLEEPLTDDEIIQRGLALGLSRPLKDDELVERAKSVLPDDELRALAHQKFGLIEPPSEADIKQRASELGFVDPSNTEAIKSLVPPPPPPPEPLSDEEIKQKAMQLGLAYPLSETEILAKARKAGMYSDDEIVQRAKQLGLEEPLTDANVRARAHNLGMISGDNAELKARAKQQLGLVEPLSDNEIKLRAKQLGLVDLKDPAAEGGILSAASERGWQPAPNRSDIVGEAYKLGLIERPSHDEYLQEGKKLGLVEPMTDHEVSNRAKEIGLGKAFSPLEIKSAAFDLGLVDPREPSSNSRGATTSPRSLSSASATSPSRNGTDPFLTKDRPTESAIAAMGPRRLPHASASASTNANAAVHEGTTTLTQAAVNASTNASLSSSANANINPSSIAKTAADAEAGNEASGKPATHSRTGSVTRTTTVVPSTPSRGKVSYTGLPEELNTSGTPIQHNVRRWEVRSPRTVNKRIVRSGTSGSLHHREKPMRSSQSGYSLSSHLSSAKPGLAGQNEVNNAQATTATATAARTLTGVSETGSNWSTGTPTTDQASGYLSQIMMGEVLYKYYGGLNFEGITGGRHKRYFWFRPETGLLYWHNENPMILGSSAAKSITIVGVEEVVDRNPIPAGLYHRSLVLKGQERDVRVTCSTQGRHFVWLYALRYIISQKASS